METTTPFAVARFDGANAPAARWVLHVLKSPDRAWQGRMVPVTVGGLMLGRATEQVNGLDVADPLLSRRHLEIRLGPRPDVLDVRDLGSKNGTWRGEQRINNTTLADGAMLRFGSSLAIVEADVAQADGFAHPTTSVPGRSGRARRLREEIELAAHGREPLLVLGPIGAGKEFVLRELHVRAGRAGPIVIISAPTLTETGFESELFGTVERPGSGLLSAAEAGTLVLDELAELPLNLQAKLLRLLETGHYRPVGSTAEVAATARIVATTNADLESAIAHGRFRRDLLSRFRGQLIHVPALAERRCDLLDCADAVLPLPGGHGHTWAHVLAPDAVEALLHHAWPENLRELATILSALARIAGERPVVAADLPGSIRDAQHPHGRAQPHAGAVALTPDVEVLRRLLRRHYGNIAKVAAHFNRDRRQIYRWLEQAGVSAKEVSDFRRGP